MSGKRIFCSVPQEILDFFEEHILLARQNVNLQITAKGKDRFVIAQLRLWLVYPSYYEYYLDDAERNRLFGLSPAKENVRLSVDDGLYEILKSRPEPIALTLKNFYFSIYAYYRAVVRNG